MSDFNRLLNGSCGCTDLLTCVYGLNSLETASYFSLVELKTGAKIEILAGALERDRSTVYRAVQKLLSLQLAERATVSMKGGGYFYVYRAASPDGVRVRIERRLVEFEAAVRRGIEAFEDEVREHTVRDGARRTPPPAAHVER